MPEDLAPELHTAGYDGTIAVQARELLKETDFLLDLARRHKIIKGVVGWVDLCARDVEAVLDRYADEPLLKGFRMLIHDHADPGFLLRLARIQKQSDGRHEDVAYKGLDDRPESGAYDKTTAMSTTLPFMANSLNSLNMRLLPSQPLDRIPASGCFGRS